MDVMDAALKCLAKQGFSRIKLYQKLVKSGFDEIEVVQCLERLAGWGYLDDRKYGITRIELLKAKLKSRNYLRVNLVESGLAQDLVESLLDEHYPVKEEVQIITEILRRRASKKRTYLQEWNSLLRSGFEEEAIRRCLPDVEWTTT